MPPLIGITTYAPNQVGEYTLPRQYSESVRRAGGASVLIPPGETHLELLLGRVEGMILAGGGDIHPACYGGPDHPTLYMMDAARDRMELELAKQALQRRIPLLAICRGAQLLNVALGGTLHAHIPDVFGQSVQHRLPPREPTEHAIRLDTESRLAKMLGVQETSCASWHHQALHRVATPLRVVAHAPDGVMEGYELNDHPWCFGVQWHPELTAARDPVQQRLFDTLVHQASRSCSERADGREETT